MRKATKLKNTFTSLSNLKKEKEKLLKVYKTPIKILTALILVSTIVRSVSAQTSSNMETFFQEDYVGISIRVDGIREAVPGENFTIKVWLNCTATGVKGAYLNLSVYGFKGGFEKVHLGTLNVMVNSTLAFNHTEEHLYEVPVPNDVWGTTYAELWLKYSILNSGFEDNPSFSMTTVRNVYYEKLQEDFQNLNESYSKLNSTYWELRNLFDELNKTYWELNHNYTVLQETVNEVSGTRQLALLLGITTVFFVGTTMYLLLRKPREYW